MKTLAFGQPIDKPICIALGYFDAIHVGHRKIINAVCSYAKDNNYQSAVFTFDNNFFEVLGKNVKLIYDLGTRQQILAELGVDNLILAHFDLDFMRESPEVFLDSLSCYDIKMVACGRDYRFGQNGSGDVETIKRHFADRAAVHVEDDVEIGGARVSSTRIRGLLEVGDFAGAELLLGDSLRKRI